MHACPSAHHVLGVHEDQPLQQPGCDVRQRILRQPTQLRGNSAAGSAAAQQQSST
jgi:hypothetical protein